MRKWVVAILLLVGGGTNLEGCQTLVMCPAGYYETANHCIAYPAVPFDLSPSPSLWKSGDL
jgi:hypothetical protein